MKDDIIELARAAGVHPLAMSEEYISGLERLVALVRAAEREACAKVCDDKAKETFSGQCAVWGDYFARAIRARGQA